MTFGQVVAGVAVVLALEGLAYAIAPGAMKRVLAGLAVLPEDGLRMGGLVAACIGIAVAWMML